MENIIYTNSYILPIYNIDFRCGVDPINSDVSPSQKINIMEKYNNINHEFLTLERTEKNQLYWNMMNRCSNSAAYPAYKGCSVCEEWSNDKESFYNWVDDHFYIYYTYDSETGTWNEFKASIDKDIRVKGNKIYSPETCMFVPKKINSFFSGSHGKKESNLPHGVGFDKDRNKFICLVNGIDDFYDTPEEAWETWKTLKESEKNSLAYSYYKQGLIPYYVFKTILDYRFEITD